MHPAHYRHHGVSPVSSHAKAIHIQRQAQINQRTCMFQKNHCWLNIPMPQSQVINNTIMTMWFLAIDIAFRPKCPCVLLYHVINLNTRTTSVIREVHVTFQVQIIPRGKHCRRSITIMVVLDHLWANVATLQCKICVAC